MPFFQESSNFLTGGGVFIDESVNIKVHNEVLFIKGAGFDALRKASIPEAIHDSSARDPPRCFPGTREEHIRNITGWASGSWKASQARILWLQGPAGVGKSALAQSCAECLGDGLGAAFFFSRPNKWNKSTRFLPTIAYQLAVKYPLYRDLVDAKVLRDPLVLEKSIEVQFRELIVGPLRELNSLGYGIGEGTTIIIDGLDECDDEDAQRVIIEVIAMSIHQETTPFLWAFFSRPEPHIAAAFASKLAREMCWQLTLPVSRDADQDIEAYLRDGFRMIRAKYNFPTVIAWPSEEDIYKLVCLSAGLFIYAASVIRYVAGSPGVLGPEAKLRLVLELGKTNNTNSVNGRPLSNLDQFYILIMKQIPKDILPSTLLSLFTQFYNTASIDDALLIHCSILGFSLTTFYAAINNLHSVLEVELLNGFPSRLSFYHASFSDFLRQVERSTPEFCADTATNYTRFCSTCANALRRLSNTDNGEASLLYWVWLANNPMCSLVNKPGNILAWPSSRTTNKHIYRVALRDLFSLFESPLVSPEIDGLQQLSCINWTLATNWLMGCDVPMYQVEAFYQKIPEDRRPKIIRLSRRSPLDDACQVISMIKGRKAVKGTKRKSYIMGNGSNKVLVAEGEFGYCEFLAL